MRVLNVLALSISPIFVFSIMVSSAKAQSYADVTMDETYVYVDVYDDAPYFATSCPDYTDVILDFAGNSDTGEAYYPGTAHASLSAANTPGTTYPGTKTIVHYGEQRGGNCGEITDVSFDISLHLGVSINFYQYSSTDGVTAYYYPIANCNTMCRHSQVTGPLVPNYEWVIENFNWFRYTTAPTGHFCVSFLAAPSNNDLSKQVCYDRGLP